MGVFTRNGAQNPHLDSEGNDSSGSFNGEGFLYHIGGTLFVSSPETHDPTRPLQGAPSRWQRGIASETHDQHFICNLPWYPEKNSERDSWSPCVIVIKHNPLCHAVTRTTWKETTESWLGLVYRKQSIDHYLGGSWRRFANNYRDGKEVYRIAIYHLGIGSDCVFDTILKWDFVSCVNNS